MINSFEDENFFLSNYFPCSIELDGIVFSSSEAAFQAMKTLDIDRRKAFAELSPEEAKEEGRKVELRPDWEEVKLDIMYRVNKAKFDQNEYLRNMLLRTVKQELVEGNDIGDTFWGVCGNEGENFLGRTLMRIRNELRGFDVEKATADLIAWTQRYFAENASPTTKAVVGISGGKDSSVAAALCAKALGTDRVLGVLMPCGTQADIECSRLLVKYLGIESVELNIGASFEGMMNELNAKLAVTPQARINTPARLRMTALYAAAACVGGRVVNTCNLSEDWVGYATKFGDGAGDFSLLSDLTVTEVIAIGDYLGLPYELTHKTPIDGLCGKTDEENLGFTYADLDDYIRGFDDLSSNPELKAKIDRMFAASRHKLDPMPKFTL